MLMARWQLFHETAHRVAIEDLGLSRRGKYFKRGNILATQVPRPENFVERGTRSLESFAKPRPS
jgi:hypothetical protein